MGRAFERLTVQNPLVAEAAAVLGYGLAAFGALGIALVSLVAFMMADNS